MRSLAGGIWRAAPVTGQDNEYVLGEVLKVDPERRAKLEDEGVFWPPDLPRSVSLEGGSW